MTNSTSDLIKETSNVERYDDTNFQLWKMHMTFIFQSCDLFDIVSSSSKKADQTSDEDKKKWEQRDKQVTVAILSAID